MSHDGGVQGSCWKKSLRLAFNTVGTVEQNFVVRVATGELRECGRQLIIADAICSYL
jgi:hypothetical protein